MNRNRMAEYITEYGYRDAGTDGPFQLLRIENESGSGTMKVLPLLDGITISYNDLSMWKAKDEPPINYPYLGINHCSEGSYEVTLKNGKICFLGPGDICLSCQDLDQIQTARVPAGHFKGLSLMIELEEAERSIKQAAPYLTFSVKDIAKKLIKNKTVVLMHANNTTERILNGMYDVNTDILKPYLITKVLELLLYIDAAFDESEYPIPQFSPTVVSRTKEACVFISQDIRRKFTSKGLAEHFNLAETSLRECFKAIYGQPLATYIRALRIENAMHLMKEDPTMPIGLVAEHCGYENQSKFASAFRSVSGYSPLEYRNTILLK